PVVVRELTPIAAAEEIRSCAIERADIAKPCGGGKLAGGNRLGQGRAGDKIKAVEIDAVGGESGGRLQILMPDFGRLAGQAIDEVDHQGGAVAVADPLEKAHGFLAARPPALPPTHLGVETLDADRETIRAGLEAGVDFFRIEMDDAALDG